VREPHSTTTTDTGDVSETTRASVTTTVDTTTTVPGPDLEEGYPESWAQALVDAANQDDFGLLDEYAFATVEKRDLFRGFVDSDLPKLGVTGPCGGDRLGFGCPFSFDRTQTYWVALAADGEETFADLIVQPQILDTIAPDGAYGSGCSPGPGPMPDGEWIGLIAERRTDEFEFDLICLLPNAYVDWEPVNESTALRTMPVDPGVLVLDLSQGDLIPMGTTYGNWGTEWCDIAGPCAAWISIRDGRVIYISEQFLS
jgi:hypothetical protein